MGNLVGHDESSPSSTVVDARRQAQSAAPLKSILKNSYNDVEQQIFNRFRGSSFASEKRDDKHFFPRYKVDANGNIKGLAEDRKVAFPDQQPIPAENRRENFQSSFEYSNTSSERKQREKDVIIRERRTRITKVTSSVTASVEEMEEVERRETRGTESETRGKYRDNEENGEFLDETLSKTFTAQSEWNPPTTEALAAKVVHDDVSNSQRSPLERSESMHLPASVSRKLKNGGSARLRRIMGSLTRSIKQRQSVKNAFDDNRQLESMPEDSPAAFSDRNFVPHSARTLSSYEADATFADPQNNVRPQSRSSRQPLPSTFSYPPPAFSPRAPPAFYGGNMQHPFAATGAAAQDQGDFVKVMELPYRKHQHSTGSVKLIRRRQQDAISLSDPRDVNDFFRKAANSGVPSLDYSYVSGSYDSLPVSAKPASEDRSLNLRNYQPVKSPEMQYHSFVRPLAFTPTYASSSVSASTSTSASAASTIGYSGNGVDRSSVFTNKESTPRPKTILRQATMTSEGLSRSQSQSQSTRGDHRLNTGSLIDLRAAARSGERNYTFADVYL